MLAYVDKHKEDATQKKKGIRGSLSQADTEKPLKRTVCLKDSQVYVWFRKGSDEKEKGWKRHGLYKEVPKQMSAQGRKMHAVGPQDHAVRK